MDYTHPEIGYVCFYLSGTVLYEIETPRVWKMNLACICLFIWTRVFKINLYSVVCLEQVNSICRVVSFSKADFRLMRSGSFSG